MLWSWVWVFRLKSVIKNIKHSCIQWLLKMFACIIRILCAVYTLKWQFMYTCYNCLYLFIYMHFNIDVFIKMAIKCYTFTYTFLFFFFTYKGPDGLPIPGCWHKVSKKLKITLEYTITVPVQFMCVTLTLTTAYLKWTDCSVDLVFLITNMVRCSFAVMCNPRHVICTYWCDIYWTFSLFKYFYIL